MANLKVLDGDANSKYLSSDGAGTDGDPYVPHHVVDELPVGAAATAAATPVTIASDDTLITALKTALELIDHLTAANSGNKDANTQRVVVATDDINLAAINAVSGTTSGSAVVTDATGTVQQYLRGLVKLIAAKIGITVADGDDVAQGTTTDAPAAADADEDATARTHTSLLKGIKNVLRDVVGLFGGGLPAALDGTDLKVKEQSPLAGFATSALQLADGHAVTIDNAAGAAAVNIQDGGNTITVDGTVTADLSSTDNAVLDTIATNTDRVPTVTPASSGSGGENIAATTSISADFYLRAVTIHFDGAWANDVEVSIDAKDGAAYDAVLRTLPGGAGVMDMSWIVEGDFLFENGDEIKVASTNPGTVTFGLRIVTEAA